MLIGDDCNWGTKYLRQNWLQFDRVFRGLNLLRCLFVCVLFAHKAVEVLRCPTILLNHSFFWPKMLHICFLNLPFILRFLARFFARFEECELKVIFNKIDTMSNVSGKE